MKPWIILILAFAGAAFIAILVLTVRLLLRRHEDRRLAHYQNDLMNRHYDEVQNVYQKMRGWRHDYHNHIQTMKAYLELNDLESLESYLDQLDNDLKSVDTVLKTGNLKLDAILNSKLSLIASRQIRTNAKAFVPAVLTVSDVDLCIIIGNLLDNAMESCERMDVPEDRFLRVYIGVLKQHLYLSVTNSTNETARKALLGLPSSSKGEGHGFGLKRVDALVSKYDGYLNRQNEPGVFATEIILPL